MKKRRLFPLFAAFLLLFLSACQSTPTQSVVTGKDNRVFLEKAKKSAEIPADTTPERVQYQEEFTSTDGSITFRMDIDTVLPYETFPVVEAVPHFLTGEEVRQIAEIILPGASFYDQNLNANPRYSREDLKRKIALWSLYATPECVQTLLGTTSEVDAAENQQYLENLKTNLKTWNTLLETAPESSPLQPCTWTFRSAEAYGMEDQGDQEICAVARTPALDYTLLANSRNQPDFRLSGMEIQMGGDPTVNNLAVLRATLLRTGKPTQAEVSSASEKVQALLDQLNAANLGTWAISGTEILTQEVGDETEYEIYLKAGPVWEGHLAVKNQFADHMVGADAYAATYYQPGLVFSYSAHGDLVYFGMDSPMDARQVLNANVALLPREELLQKAVSQLRLSDVKNAFGIPSSSMLDHREELFDEKIRCEIEITSLSYDLGRIKAPGDDDTYYYVPLFVLSGMANYYGVDSGTLYLTSTDFGGIDLPLITLNAIDGTVVSF